jgi:hypothetical protein
MDSTAICKDALLSDYSKVTAVVAVAEHRRQKGCIDWVGVHYHRAAQGLHAQG